MKYILFTIFLCTPLLAMTQFKFKAGYIIKMNGDSIAGLISIKKDEKMRTICNFKYSSDNPVKYSPKELHSFKFFEGKYYVSKYLPNSENTESVFLEYLVNGKIDLFYSKEKHENHYYIENEDGEILELKNSKYIISDATTSYTKTKKEYIGILKNTFNDCSEIQNNLNRVEFNHRDLIATTKNYHELTCNEYECITYNKDIKLKYSIGYTFGVSNSSIHFKSKDFRFDFIDKEQFKYTPSITTGIIVSITNFFSLGKNQSFNFQLAYKGCEYKSKNIKIAQQTIYIPLYYSYSFTKSKLKPILNYGFSNSFYLNTSIDMENNIDKENTKKTIGNYMISGLAGIGIDYTGVNLSYMLYSNYEIGSGIIKSEHKNNYYNSLSNYFIINFGIRYNL